MKEVTPKPVAKAPAAKTQAPFFGHAAEQQPFIAREADDRAFFQMPIQTKLTVGAPNSPAEEEADRMAEQVVQRLAQPETVQRECADCEKEEVKRQPEEKELQEKPLAAQIHRQAAPEDLDKENPAVARKATPDEEQREEKLQRQAEEKEEQIAAKSLPEEEQIAAKPATGTEEKKDEIQTKSNGEASVSPGIAARLSSSKGGGQPLSESVRSPMEQAFGADFRGVQIHTGTEAAQLSQDLHAQAFTHGQDVYFNAGKYQPETTEGKRLLGHELTHVVQGGVYCKAFKIRKKESEKPPEPPSKVEVLGYDKETAEEKINTFFGFNEKELQKMYDAAEQDQLLQKNEYLKFIEQAVATIAHYSVFLTENERNEKIILIAKKLALQDKLKKLVKLQAIDSMKEFFNRIKITKDQVLRPESGLRSRISVASKNLREIARTIVELNENKEQLQVLVEQNENIRREARNSANLISRGIHVLNGSVLLLRSSISDFLDVDQKVNFLLELQKAEGEFESTDGKSLFQFLYRASRDLDKIRSDQIGAINVVLSKIYISYPLFSVLSPEDAISGSLARQDEKLWDSALEAQHELEANSLEVIRYLSEEKIHPFELPVSIQEVKRKLSEEKQKFLEQAVSEHESKEFWKSLSKTAILLLLPVLGPYGVAASMGLGALDSSDRLVDVFRKSVISDLVPEGEQNPLLFHRVTFWDEFIWEVGSLLVDLGGGAVFEKLTKPLKRETEVVKNVPLKKPRQQTKDGAFERKGSDRTKSSKKVDSIPSGLSKAEEDNLIKEALKYDSLESIQGDYRVKFKSRYPDFPGGQEWQVHHSIPQKFRKTISDANINVDSIEFLRGIRTTPGKTKNAHSKLTNYWEKWHKDFNSQYKREPNAAEIIMNAKQADWQFGHIYWEVEKAAGIPVPTKKIPRTGQSAGSSSAPSMKQNVINPPVADPRLPPGEGYTTKFGEITYSSAGSKTDQALVLAHEQIHSLLSPKLKFLRNFRANLRMSGYEKSALLKYVEEALSETYAQIRVLGIRNMPDGIRFPITNGYVTIRGVIVEGLIGTIVYGGIVYGVYLWSSSD